MRNNIFYNSKNIFPCVDLASNLKLYKQISNCTHTPISDNNNIYITISDFNILVLDIETLELKTSISLIDYPVFKTNKKENDIYLMIQNNLLFIQYIDSLYSYNINTDVLSLILEEKNSFLIYESFIINNKIIISTLDKEISIYCFDFESKKTNFKITDVIENNFLLSNDFNLIFADTKNLKCYNYNSNKISWKQELAHYGDYYDEIWETENKGYISTGALMIDDQIITTVEQGKIISLNCKNGEINWIITLGEDTNVPQIRYCEGDEYLYALSNHIYEIDFHSGTIINSSYIQKDLNELNLATGQFGISKSSLYIGTARREPYLLIIDKKTFKIVNKHPIPTHCDFYGFPAVMGKYLAILDQAKNVLFFKETE
jgi:outer membrane protein assembly factor BamB